MHDNIKAFSLRLPKDLWAHLRKCAYEDHTTMNEIIVYLVAKHKKNLEKVLTKLDIAV